MAFPYKKMDQADFSAIQSFTDTSRVWIGEDIPYEYHHDEMPRVWNLCTRVLCRSHQ